MPNDVRYKRSFGSRFRLMLRFLGVTGLLAVGVGGVLLASELPAFDLPTITKASHGEISKNAQIFSYVVAGGLALALLAMFCEILANLGKAAGRRSAVGFNAGVQITLATFLLLLVNYMAFRDKPVRIENVPEWANAPFRIFDGRWDLTKAKQFTLPPEIVDHFSKFQGSATIVVLQQHKTFGQLSNKPDGTDYAAERKVVEKVRDLVDQLRALGSRYKVVTLDVEEDGYDKKLDELAKTSPGLKEAVKAAPENSIFFVADGRVQRLSFNEFYQLDKAASREANDGNGNLVLRPQGLQAFASRVLAIQERKPRVGVAVIHEWLTTIESEGSVEQYSSHGLRKALESYGFEVVDIVLKKWGGRAPTPAAYNLEETQFERLESELALTDADMRENREEKKDAEEIVAMLKTATLDDLKKRFGRRVRVEIDETFRKRNVEAATEAIEGMDRRYEEMKKERDDIAAKLAALSGKEKAFEDRRVTDVKAKFTRVAADCDMLIVPRMTLFNATADNDRITPRVHKLEKEQIEVVKDFMKSGKPVLALIGPGSVPADEPPSDNPLDDFEKLLADRGVELGQQTILFDSESKGFAARKSGDMFGGGSQEIPPVVFKPGNGKVPNPLAAAMGIAGRNVDQPLDIRMRAPRPVYMLAGFEGKQPFTAEFVFTAPESWNEEMPFASVRQQGGALAISTPRFEATRFDDPKKNTRDEERRGPFPVGVSIDTKVPVDWIDPKYADYRAAVGLAPGAGQGILAACLTATAAEVKRPTERLVVFGQGGLFAGKTLTPAVEKLLLNTCNWLLGREDRLPRADAPEWSYPRVELDEKRKFLWHWGTFLGLPAFFAWLGLIVLMIRKVR